MNIVHLRTELIGNNSRSIGPHLVNGFLGAMVLPPIVAVGVIPLGIAIPALVFTGFLYSNKIAFKKEGVLSTYVAIFPTPFVFGLISCGLGSGAAGCSPVSYVDALTLGILVALVIGTGSYLTGRIIMISSEFLKGAE